MQDNIHTPNKQTLTNNNRDLKLYNSRLMTHLKIII